MRPFCSSSSFLLLFFLLVPLLVGATVTVVSTGKTYPSRPERHLGERLWHGYPYLGRLQMVSTNAALCRGVDDDDDDRTFAVVPPSDGLPVAIYATAGGCSLREKAIVASQLLRPLHIAAYLIVQDRASSNRRRADNDDDDDDDDDEREWITTTNDEDWSVAATLQQQQRYPTNATGTVPQTPNVMIKHLQLDAAPVLRKHHDTKNDDDTDEISVAILHVSNKVGYDLLGVLWKEDDATKQQGGTKILLDSRGGSPATAQTIFVWTCLTMLLSAAACCCLLLVQQEEREEARPPPRPVRRRLTHQQVRDKYPVFHYHPSEHPLQEEQECPICLDEYCEGVRCRQLPCNHVFHSTCIGRWLIERNAFCPLCKYDLYEEEEEEEGEEEEEEVSPRELTFWEWFSTTVHNRAAEPPQGPNGAATQPTEAATPLTAPPMSMFRRLREGRVEETATATTNPSTSATTPSWWSRIFRRERRIRLGTEPGLQTELTEPLISSSQGGSPDVAVVEEVSPPDVERASVGSGDDEEEATAAAADPEATETRAEV